MEKKGQNPAEKVKEYNKVIEIINRMQKSVTIWSNTYDKIAKLFGCDFQIELLKKSLDDYSNQLDYIYNKYFADDDEAFTDEINDAMIAVNRNINESISILVKEYNRLF